MPTKDSLKKAIEKRKEREKQLRIEDILAAAQTAFLVKGFFGVTMDDIAIEAGFTKPTIYKYFKSKEELFGRLIIPVITELRDQLVYVEQQISEKRYQSAAELLHEFFQATYNGYCKSPESFRIIQIFQQSGDIWKISTEMRAELNTLGKTNANRGRQIVRLAIEQGLIVKYDEIELLDVLYSVFTGLIQVSDIKSHRGGYRQEKGTTEAGFLNRLALAEQLLINALST